MRSFLTVLGVIIGTGAVIGVGSIIAGLDGAITNLLRSFGPNTMIVTKTAAMGNATREERAASRSRWKTRAPSPSAAPRWSTSAPTCLPRTACTPRKYKGNDMYNIQWAAPRRATPPAAPP
jgi:putative ABC transport system permease protein